MQAGCAEGAGRPGWELRAQGSGWWLGAAGLGLTLPLLRCLQTQEKYEKVLDDVGKTTPQYMEGMEQVFEQCQQFEEKRLVFLKEVLLDIKRHLSLAENSRWLGVAVRWAQAGAAKAGTSTQASQAVCHSDRRGGLSCGGQMQWLPGCELTPTGYSRTMLGRMGEWLERGDGEGCPPQETAAWEASAS